MSGTVTGPFTVASMLVGTENLLKGMVKQPDKVLQMMNIITENNNRYIQRLLDMGVGVGFADPVSSTSLLRVKQYDDFIGRIKIIDNYENVPIRYRRLIESGNWEYL